MRGPNRTLARVKSTSLLAPDNVLRRLADAHLLHPRREPQRGHGVVRILLVRTHAAQEEHLRVRLEAVPEQVRQRRIAVRHGPVELAPGPDDVVEGLDALVGESGVVLLDRAVALGARRGGVVLNVTLPALSVSRSSLVITFTCTPVLSIPIRL